MVPERLRSPEMHFRLLCFRLLCSRLFCLALFLTAFLPSHAVAAGKNYAILFGVGDYKEWTNLVNPVPDVVTVAGELQHRYGFLPEVVKHPDRKTVLAKLRRYVEMQYGPEDQLLIVFSGHGTYDEVTRIGYLAGRDSETRPRDPNFTSHIAYPWLLTLIDNIPCRRILLIVDACYSGSLASGRNGSSPGSSEKNSRQFLTSGGIEYVSDGEADRHTPFVRQLLAGLRSRKMGEALTLETLHRDFMKKVKPSPLWGSFDAAGGTDFRFVASGNGPSRTLISKAVAVSESSPPPPAAVILRTRPKAVERSELKRVYRRLELFDATWNLDGDFPNEFRRQEGDLGDVMIDLESNLMWQQSGADQRMSREAADVYILEFNRSRYAGHGDWRLPTLEELASLVESERQQGQLFIHPFFDPKQGTCWSADRDKESGHPFYVSYETGRTTLGYGTKTASVRAVRSLATNDRWIADRDKDTGHPLDINYETEHVTLGNGNKMASVSAVRGHATKEPKKRVAVIAFENQTLRYPKKVDFSKGNLGNRISEMLVEKLISTKKFVVLERQGLAKDFREKRFFTPEIQARLASAQVLIMSNITDINVTEVDEGTRTGIFKTGEKQEKVSIKINLLIIDSSTGEVIEAGTFMGTAKEENLRVTDSINGLKMDLRVPISKATDKAVHEVVRRLVEVLAHIPWQSNVTRVSRRRIFVNAGLQENVVPGLQFRVFERSAESIGRGSNNSPSRFDKEIGIIEIERVGARFSVARVIEGEGVTEGNIVKLLQRFSR